MIHEPVLVREVVGMLGVARGGVYIDGTVGSGGHANALMESGPDATSLLGVDRDGEALTRAGERLRRWGNRVALVRGNFSDMAEIAMEQGVRDADGILLDLGVSLEQLQTPDRGFSFQNDGPLDMRMDRRQEQTAETLVNEMPEEELAGIIRELGEEPRARRIAARIAYERKSVRITSTVQLSGLVESVVGRSGRIHPATRTFQALRMKVNSELEHLEKGLEAGLGLLRPGGRMAVISFHSIEDRCVKRCFGRHAGVWESAPAGGERWKGDKPAVKRINRKPITASEAEVEANPRARSAKLRVVEMCLVAGGSRGCFMEIGSGASRAGDGAVRE